MSESIIREKAKEFAKNIVFLTKEIKINKKESVYQINYYVREQALAQISTKRNTHKERQTLFQS